MKRKGCDPPVQLGYGLLGWFIGCVEFLVVVEWSVGIQLTWWTTHQTCRLAYVGIKGNQQ